MAEYHQPVLVNEVERLIDPVPGGIYVDATLGGGGHSQMLLEKSAPDGLVIGIDRDSEAIEFAKKRLERFGERFVGIKSNFANAAGLLEEYAGRINGYLMDLGVSSHQLDTARGFSFVRDEPLDMRMDTSEDTPTALDIVNRYSKDEIAAIIREYGEERHYNLVAAAVVKAREKRSIQTTGDLAGVIRSAIGRFYAKEKIDPCTRTFMGLRIFVNRELDSIKKALPEAVDLLAPGGRLAVISFHSLEDRLVKNRFRVLSGRCMCPPKSPICQCGAVEKVRILTPKPIVPSQDEIGHNPRARSSKLRCVERI